MKAYHFVIISFLFLGYSCKKECPSFDRSLLCWIPYEINDTILLSNNQNDTLFFFVNDKTIFDDNTKYGSYDKYSCGSLSSAYLEEINAGNSFIREEIFYGGTKNIQLIISVYINKKVGEFSLSTDNIQNSVIEEIIIDDKIFNNVIIIEADTIEHPKYSEYWKVILAKNKGIVKLFGRDTIPDLTIIE